MDKKEAHSQLDDDKIYRIVEFTNAEGFKIIEHRPVLTEGKKDDGTPSQFYGMYVVETDFGPLDRFFTFEPNWSLQDCFDNFKSFAQEDVEVLSKKIQEQKLLEATAPPDPDEESPENLIELNPSKE